MRTTWLGLFALLLVNPGCRHRPDLVQTPVSYLGHDDGVQPPHVLPTKRVFVVVENQLGGPRQIGEDNSTHVPIHADPAAVAQLIQSGLRFELKRVGVPVAEAAQDSDVVLKVALTDVRVVENFTYYATLLVTVDVTDSGGNSLGRFSLQGEAGHFGDDYSGTEVNATLNNALAALINNAFQSADLMRLLGAG